MRRFYFSLFAALFYCSFLFAQNRISGIPAGYYNSVSGLTCSSLKTALKNIISNGTTQLAYSDVWTAFATTDTRPAPNNNIIWDMYSDNNMAPPAYIYTYGINQCGSYNQEGDCYNREHSVPESWFNGNFPMYTDLHHLFATDGWVNNKRGNYIYAKVASASYTSSNGSRLGTSGTTGISGVVFEPIDEFKGDFARAFFYMITRYESGVSYPVTSWTSNVSGGTGYNVFSGNTYPSVTTAYLNMMYNWHVLDPVSQKEIDRNDAVYALQGNRNPYIDSPQFVQRVFSCASTVVGIEPIASNNNDWRMNINIGPNPTSSYINIALDRTINKRLSIELFDITGRRILSESIAPFSSSKQLQIRSSLSPGQYLIRISGNSESVTNKIVVLP
jgi:endonuclease I